MRQIVLDTETTGFEHSLGHRIIEIGCVEIVNRKLTGNSYQRYINPKRDSDPGALEVHGLTTEFLTDKPLFEEVYPSFLEFIKDAELIIHNAVFDIGFLNAELSLLSKSVGKVEDYISKVTDSLLLARAKHPGQKNNLDALCKRYGIDNSKRDLHGALLDAEILAEVYLAMTGGQTALLLNQEDNEENGSEEVKRLSGDRASLKITRASVEERQAHENILDKISKKAEQVVWRNS
jgi:DNA polymerase-3 subunit epsilon